MKTRCGFVSNSSTTSFCIYGIIISSDTMVELAKTLGVLQELGGEEAITTEALSELVELKVEKGSKLAMCYGESYDYSNRNIYLGRNLTDAPDDMTMGDYKASIREEIKKIFGKEIDCGVYEEAYRDG